MRPVLTAEEYRRVDLAYTGDLDAAMDRAGHAVALAAARNGAGYGSRVAVLAGPGNNGGDGYVAARYLKARGAHVEVYSYGPPRTVAASRAAAAAADRGVPLRGLEAPVAADLVIDALFGGGIRGGLPDSILAWMDHPAPVVAVDYPTGLDPDTGTVEERAFHAVETVTFETVKTGHLRAAGPEHCGVVTVADIGIGGGRPSMWLAEREDAPRPPRHRTAHKWSAGAVLVAGGSRGLVGAAVFAGRAALAFGAGSVVVASSRPDLVTSVAPELPAMGLEEALPRLDRFEVVLAGPGLDQADVPAALPLAAGARRVVLDAGALRQDMTEAAAGAGAALVLTPHSGEFRRLTGVDGGAFSARALAARIGGVVLLKGSPTLISDGGPPILVTTGGPELASIGTGDVLAGMLAALWSRGLEAVEATVSAAYWHGVAAADLARNGTVTAPALARHVARFAWDGRD